MLIIFMLGNFIQNSGFQLIMVLPYVKNAIIKYILNTAKIILVNLFNRRKVMADYYCEKCNRTMNAE